MTSIPTPDPDSAVEWAKSAGLVPYETAVALMEERVRLIACGRAAELVWLLEHPPLYTAGTSTKPDDLLAPSRFPVYATGRGGELTYHGPGQRVAYVMLDIRRRFGSDVRAFVGALQDWIIDTLATLGVEGGPREGRIGVWVAPPAGGPGREAKIAALGVRIRNGISFHGIAINVAPELEHFSGIVPCGIREFGVTSLAALGSPATLKDVDIALANAFGTRFAKLRAAPAPVLASFGPPQPTEDRSPP
jgi:lipoyl(octanoyl) transferase